MISVYTDGSSKNGFGHIYRTVNLFYSFKKKIFFLIDNNKNENEKALIRKIINKFNFKIKFIKKSIEKEFKADFNKTLLIDHPKNSEKIINIANQHYKKIIIIDDEGNLKKYNCDLLINQNNYSKKFLYKSTNKNIKRLLGTKYTILNSDRIKKKILLKNNNKRILLLFGATDVGNNYIKFCRKINDYDLFILVNNKIIENKINNLNSNNINLLFDTSLSKAISIYKIDVVITCCGSSLYQLFSYAIPVIGIKCSYDQRNAYKYYSTNKSIIASNLNEIQKDLKKLTLKKKRILIKNSNKFFNYNGKYLIASAIRKIV